MKNLFALSLLAWLTLPVAAQSHYMPEGAPVRDQTGLPPLPGVYYSNSLMFLNMDANLSGRALKGRVPFDVHVGAPVVADMNTFIWQTGEKFLGADYGVVGVLPSVVQATPSARIEAARFLAKDASTSAFGLFDVYFSPLALTWRGDQHQILFNYGLWAPVGGETSLGYWEHQFQLGGSYFFDKEKSWSVSALGTYEINGYNSKRDYTKGNYFTLEWGIVKNLDPNLTLGLVGYDTWQVSGDSGAGLRLAYDPVRDYAHGIGGEIKLTLPEANFLSIALKHTQDISSHGRLSGSTTTLNFSIPIDMEMPAGPPPAQQQPPEEGEPSTSPTPPAAEP